MESDFIAKVSYNVTTKSVMHGIGKQKNTTAIFSGRVTCFIQLVSLARTPLAITREGVASETICYSVVGHHGSILLQLDYMYKVRHVQWKMLPTMAVAPEAVF